MKRKTSRKKSAPTHRPTPSPHAVTPESPHVDGPSEPSDKTTFPIVGIGASAGGLEAFSQLLRALPTDTGMAFVLVQHLDPGHESQLPEILSRTTMVPVVTVTDRLRVEPDHVYVIPPNADMTIGGGAFTITPRAAVDRHTPIDHFLCSLAQEQEGRAIGVVLSGTGSDGTLGLRAIKAEGGITFVQDAKSAKHPGMPQSALPVADFVLPPAGIARELARIGSHPYVNHAMPAAAGPGQPDEGADVSAVLRVLRNSTGVDFAQYKPATVRRRIARRMLLQKIDDLGTYVRHLRQTPHEAEALRDDILIRVTGFFRDPEGFEALRLRVFPSLVKERAAGEPIRIWVPGCATGEEAYSLVICLLEFLEETDSHLPIQMFATDLSAAAVTRARAGAFPASIESEVSPGRLRRFFVKTDGRYQISKAIRDVCVFATQDLTRDPPFSKLDLVSCCNVLIYLGAALQDRVIPVLHYALKPTGVLKLGPSESVGRFTNLFSVTDKKHKIYARKSGPSAHLGFGLSAGERSAAPAGAELKAADWSAAAVEKEADRLILGRYAPAGVVVNADMEIVQFRGKTGPYLEAMPGTASLNLFKMAREGLPAALRRAVQHAATSGGTARAKGLRVGTNGGIREVSLEVIPLGPAEGAKARHHLVLFFEDRRRPTEPSPLGPARKREPRPKTAGERRVAQLTQELAAAHQHLQAISEEHEAAMEELRATTEEAQSSNEELQSTNEELETAKEELQATNEELTTVNDELTSRNLELSQLSNDLGNLLTSTHVPIVMVGSDLRVRRMTSVTERVLNMAPADVGRPIGDLRLSVEVPDLEALLRDVIETLTVQEREVQARDGRWHSVRVRPYRTADNKIDGAVISFIDIDAIKRGLEEVQAAHDQAQAIIATVREPLVILDADLRVVTANRSFYTVFQVAREDTERRSIFDLGNRQWDIPQLRTQLEEVLPRDNAFENFEIEHDFETIGRRVMRLHARHVLSAAGQPTWILLAIEDVTEPKRLEAARAALEREQAARTAAEAETLAKDQFVAVLSHELRTPLTAILGWTRMLRTQKLDQAAAARALEVVERNTLLQARLIEDLLDVSRIITGNLRIEERPVMVAPVVQAALATMRPAAEAKGVVVESALDENAGPVRGDPARLQQIVGNLVTNAIKFTPSGGRVDVRLARRGSAAELSVRDTGRGITAEQLPHIFGRFGVAHASTETQGGLGLGLAIVRHLVELHGGTVQAASTGPGQGATFTVTLPLTDERPAGETEARGIAARGLASGRLPALEGIRVLVVDDEADTRELVRAILAQCGAEVSIAATAQAALDALEQAPFDVLVSDIRMPEEDGNHLIREVRALDIERGGRIPALALTAYARIEDREATLSAGYQQFAAKPIEPAELAAAVAALAGRTAAR
ncbi:MAG: PAS domain-containing protein [Candidatus Rokubacteria bacterium]|nr:PAS domain-containing protein [Candidatus Rokubacteria bacterium]